MIIFALVFVFGLHQTAKAQTQNDVDFEQIFDEHGAVMLLIDNETGDILYANNAAAMFYGYTKQTLESMNIAQINSLVITSYSIHYTKLYESHYQFS